MCFPKYPLRIGLNYLKSTFHLMLIYNHAVADGISGVILTNQILENYIKLKKNEKLDMTCTRVKTIAELKSDAMPDGDANVQKLTDYANKVSPWSLVESRRHSMIKVDGLEPSMIVICVKADGRGLTSVKLF